MYHYYVHCHPFCSTWNGICFIDVEYLFKHSELQSTFHGIRQKFGEEREDLCFKLIRLVTQ